MKDGVVEKAAIVSDVDEPPDLLVRQALVERHGTAGLGLDDRFAAGPHDGEVVGVAQIGYVKEQVAAARQAE